MSNWYCIRTATRQEFKAVEGLHELGFSGDEIYLPCETRWNRLGRVKRPKDVPLLPGYMFLRAEADQLWRVENVSGVYSVLRHAPNAEGDRIAVSIPNGFVGDLRADQALGKFDKTQARGRGLEIRKGAKITVSAGSWSGWSGEIVEERTQNRVKVLLSFIGSLKVPPKDALVSIADIGPQDTAPSEAA